MNENVKHPGELLRTLVVEPTGLSQAALARYLGFNQPQPINELIKARRGITPKMALLLERLTQKRYCAEFWLLAQLRWDLSQARGAVPSSRLALVQAVDDQSKLENCQQDRALLSVAEALASC
ncbi:MAG: addiction module antidote protein, HigA family [Gammaproteobacteria bacterium]|nr:MAG: addiction module antidote protein, HigA family [Gammaproteobacteria bacterium]